MVVIELDIDSVVVGREVFDEHELLCEPTVEYRV